MKKLSIIIVAILIFSFSAEAQRSAINKKSIKIPISDIPQDVVESAQKFFDILESSDGFHSFYNGLLDADILWDYGFYINDDGIISHTEREFLAKIYESRVEGVSTFEFIEAYKSSITDGNNRACIRYWLGLRRSDNVNFTIVIINPKMGTSIPKVDLVSERSN